MEFHITSSMLYWMDLQWIQCYWIESQWSQCYIENNLSYYNAIEWDPTEVNVILIGILLSSLFYWMKSHWSHVIFIEWNPTEVNVIEWNLSEFNVTLNVIMESNCCNVIEWNPNEFHVTLNGSSVNSMLLNRIPVKSMLYWK